MSTTMIPMSKIIPDPDQPRKFFDEAKITTLAKSLKSHGIMNPLVVEKHGDNFLIVDGERRYRAAKQIGLKEVPIVIVPTVDKFQRAVEQFHLQEMHEGWSPTERAMVIGELCTEMKKNFTEVCTILGILPSNARKLYAISRMADKEAYGKNNISLEYAEPILSLSNYVKKLRSDNEQPFTLTDKKQIERSVIKNIVEGAFTNGRDVTRMKDIFKSDPKTIEKFISGANPQDLFVSSKARAAQNLRAAVNDCGYMVSHISIFLKKPDIKLTSADVSELKRARKYIDQLLALAGTDE